MPNESNGKVKGWRNEIRRYTGNTGTQARNKAKGGE